MTRERPILFAGELVRAILQGTKTQTRRLVTPATSVVDGQRSGFPWHELDFSDAWVDPGPSPMGNPGPYLKVARHAEGDHFRHRIYSRVWDGDRLWVRETWQTGPIAGKPAVAYRASCPGDEFVFAEGDDVGVMKVGKWRPSLHMPRWASRITLEVTAVRVERLQQISEADARAEGISKAEALVTDPITYRAAFRRVWDSVYPSADWSSNPWVWVIAFRRITPAAEAPLRETGRR